MHGCKHVHKLRSDSVMSHRGKETLSPDSFEIHSVANLLQDGLSSVGINDQHTLLCTGLLAATKLSEILR